MMMRRKRDEAFATLEAENRSLKELLSTARHYTIPELHGRIGQLEATNKTLSEENDRLHHELDKRQDRIDYLVGFHREVSRG